MFYNIWRFDSSYGNKPTLVLDESDDVDRESQRPYSPCGYPGRAWIYFPRRDKKTNDKYKKILLDYISKRLSDQIKNDTEILNSLPNL